MGQLTPFSMRKIVGSIDERKEESNGGGRAGENALVVHFHSRRRRVPRTPGPDRGQPGWAACLPKALVDGYQRLGYPQTADSSLLTMALRPHEGTMPIQTYMFIL